MDEKKIAYAEHKYARISPRKVECTESISAPATSTSPWLRENKERRLNHGSKGKSAWVARWRY